MPLRQKAVLHYGIYSADFNRARPENSPGTFLFVHKRHKRHKREGNKKDALLREGSKTPVTVWLSRIMVAPEGRRGCLGSASMCEGKD